MTPVQKEEELRILFNQWLNEACDGDDIRKLVNYADDQEMADVWGNLLAELPAGPVSDIGDHEHAAVMEKVYQNLIQLHPKLRSKPALRRISPFLRYAAAVMFALVLGGTSYFIFHKPGRKATIAKTVLKNDLPPGKVGAILTLGNGQQIVLDSLGNGIIASENGVNIELKDRQLAYNKDVTNAGEITYNTMSTPAGRKYQLTLSDGTRVWLNAASSITFPTVFTSQERVVSITGEAYFEVTKNPKKPFRVTVNDMKVEVMGTHFNINAYADEMLTKTTLLEGSVKVTRDNDQQLLTPGQQAQLDMNNRLKLESNVDIEQEMAWRNNEFYFKYTDLKTVMRQLARWYDLEIAYDKGAAINLRFDGEIPMDTMISQVLTILEKSGVHFNLEGKKLTVLP